MAKSAGRFADIHSSAVTNTGPYYGRFADIHSSAVTNTGPYYCQTIPTQLDFNIFATTLNLMDKLSG
jgi:hypothetical protein